MINSILRLFGYKINPKNSLLMIHMFDVTHETWLQQIYRQNKINQYIVK